jgi:hypothetical protein
MMMSKCIYEILQVIAYELLLLQFNFLLENIDNCGKIKVLVLPESQSKITNAKQNNKKKKPL